MCFTFSFYLSYLHNLFCKHYNFNKAIKPFSHVKKITPHTLISQGIGLLETGSRPNDFLAHLKLGFPGRKSPAENNTLPSEKLVFLWRKLKTKRAGGPGNLCLLVRCPSQEASCVAGFGKPFENAVQIRR